MPHIPGRPSEGHGAPVRYGTLPYESHGYAARESVLHVVAEMVEWCITYLSGTQPRLSIPRVNR